MRETDLRSTTARPAPLEAVGSARNRPKPEGGRGRHQGVETLSVETRRESAARQPEEVAGRVLGEEERGAAATAEERTSAPPRIVGDHLGTSQPPTAERSLEKP